MRSSQTLHRLERLLFWAGISLLAVFILGLAYARFSQAYYDWAFERSIRGKPAPVLEFLAQVFRPESGGTERSEGPRPGAHDRTGAPTIRIAPPPGSPIGRLEIPSLDLSVMVLEGTSRMTLARGVGRIEGTALPGTNGNIGLAGHRDSFFRALKDISEKDRIVLTTPEGTYEYAVDKTRVVRPTETSVLDRTREPILTLVTCYPFYYMGHAPKRFIVQATMLPGNRASAE